LSSVLLTLTPLLSSVVYAADPFYLRLFSLGTDAFNRRDYKTAARDLRVACFGMLDEPPLLADCLTRLALAQSSSGDDAEFRETFQRLSEVEERFQGYSRADIPRDVRSAFESLVVEKIPRATFSANPTFARFAPTRQDTVATLPPAQRRKELTRLIKSEPTELSWRLMLAELDLSEGHFRDAYATADGAFKLFAGNKDALKLRGLALAAEKKWPQAESDLKACGFASSDPRVAGALLSCLVEQQRWQEASDLAAQLPPEVAKDRTVQQLTVTAAAGLTAARPAATPTPVMARGPAPTFTPWLAGKAAATAGAGTLGVPPQTRPAGTGVLSPAEKADLGRARELAKAGRLDDAFALARKVADARPDVVEPQLVAAEMAYRSARWDETTAFFQLAVSAAVRLTTSQPAVTPTVVMARGPAPTYTPWAAARPTTIAERPTPTGRLAQVPTPTPRPTQRPATGIAATAGAGAPALQAKKPATVPGVLSPAESANLDRVRELANAGDLDGALALARKVADARPDCAEPQFVTAELAYRTSRWKEAVAYFRRGGDPGDGRPLLLFYQAVSLYEAGDRVGAAVPLKRCLPKIKHTPFVEGYARAILGEATSATQKP